MSGYATGDVLRRAVNRLEELDRVATAGPWMQDVIEHDPGEWGPTGDLLSLTPLAEVMLGADDRSEIGGMVSREDAALIVALRPVAGPLAKMLRCAIDTHDPIMRVQAVAVARAILGETEVSR